jgi:hypothetical protein
VFDTQTFMRAQLEVLETLFPSGWFAIAERRFPLHPAYVQWSLFTRLVNESDPRFGPADPSVLLRGLLDSMATVMATEGSIVELRLGDLSNYGDAAVRQRLAQVVQNPTQFRDVMVEVYCAASLKAKGHLVTATEEVGFPDLTIRVEGWEFPVAAECKRLSKGPNRIRLQDVIKKANRQVRRAASPAYGVLYLDVSDWVSEQYSLGQSVDKPSVVQGWVAELLRQYYSSLSGVVLLWRDVIPGPMLSGESAMLYILRCNSRFVRHGAPIRPLPDDSEKLELRFTIGVKLPFSHRCEWNMTSRPRATYSW